MIGVPQICKIYDLGRNFDEIFGGTSTALQGGKVAQVQLRQGEGDLPNVSTGSIYLSRSEDEESSHIRRGSTIM